MSSSEAPIMINLSINRPHFWFFIFMLGLLALMGSAHAATDPIGKVILSVGEVTAQNSGGALRQLERRGRIFEGDLLTTSEGARCQIRFTDGSLLALPELSQFRVDEYRYDGTEDNEKAIYSLLKGGMRTITGAIGKKTKENYKVNTPVATIGIRGTAYHAFLYRLPSGEVQLYGGVQYGMITVDNEAGSTLFDTNQNFRVLNSRQRAKILLTLPDFYPSQSEEDPADGNEEGASGSEDSTVISDSDLNDEDTAIISKEQASSAGTPSTIDSAFNEEPQGTEDVDNTSPVSSRPAPNGSMVAIAFTENNAAEGTRANTGVLLNVAPNELYLDTVTGIGNIPVGALAYDTDCNPCNFVPGTATLTDTGGNPVGVNWGRWDGDYVVMKDNVLTQTSGSFHYIYTPNVTPLSTLQARTGYAYYTLAGGTAPTDQAGNIGTLNYFDMNVDFDLQEISSAYLDATVGALTISASSTGPTSIPNVLSSGIGIGMLDASGGLDGHVDMNFIGQNAEAIAASYGFHDSNLPSTRAITGTALLIDGSGSLAY
jgi:hypothetical protein